MATQKIHFFTDKDGIGKSTVCAGFALKKSMNTNDKILLTELSEESHFKEIILTKHQKTLSIEQWNANSCLSEYASRLLRSTSLSKILLNNSVSKALINAAPGLQELAILGKATSGPRNHGPQMNYDEIFIDSFASGHFLNLVVAPESFAEVFSIGPMATQSKSINLWLKNKDFTNVHIVTMSDELITTESIELYRQLTDLNMHCDFIFNKFTDFDKINFKKLETKTHKFFKNIYDQQKSALSEIKKLNCKIEYVPYFFEQTFEQTIQQVSKL